MQQGTRQRCHQLSTRPDPQSRQSRGRHVQKQKKAMITTGRDCGSAEWINNFLVYD